MEEKTRFIGSGFSCIMRGMEQTMQTIKKPETSPKDFFLHLLAIVTLYASAISFLVLAFQYINVSFPDVLEGYWNARGAYEGMRWAIAMLFVIFPVYIGTNLFLNKEYKAVPEKKELKIRRWLVHFTLFVTALVIIGGLVALLLNFLKGELTTRFLLKLVSIFFVAGSVFGFYLWDLKNKTFTKGVKGFVYAVSAIVVASIVFGVVTAGSPATERARRLDDQRISHLSSIQWQLVEYWRSKEALPEDLSVLNDALRGFTVPKDPATEEPYEYRKTGETSFT